LFRAQALYHTLWPNLSGRSVAYAVAADAKLKSINSGFALSYVHDVSLLGASTSDYLSLTYAYYFKLFQSKLEFIPSMQFTYGQTQLDINNLPFGEGFHWHYYPSSYIRKVYFDMNAGFLLRHKAWYFGATAFHVNQPDVGMLGIERLPTRYSFHTSYNFTFSQNAMLNVLLKFNTQEKLKYSSQGENQNNGSAQASLLLRKHFIVGTGYDSQYYYLLNMGYRARWFTASLVYANDLLSSDNVYDAWELNLAYQLRPKAQRAEVGNFEAW